MGAIENIKDVAKLLQTIGNTEILQKMIAVQTEFLELLDKNHELQDKNRELREKLRQKERMDELLAKRSYRDNAYWIDDEGPYCTGCWDGKDRVVRMAIDHLGHGHCPLCKHVTSYD